nr:MBG domain-containing protein [Clostridia bacterium]
TTVSYENQTATDVGVYSASATVNYDDGNRCGQTVLYATLTINKSNYDMSGVSFKDATYIYDGQEKSIVATGLPDGVTVSYDTQPTSLVGEYIITASFNGDEKNYFEIPSKTATLKIKKATYDLKNVTYSAYPSDYYTGEAHTLVANGLPDGVTVSFNDEGKCINAGEYFLNATFTVTNENYNKIPSKQMTLTIKKATVDMSAVSFESKIVTYDGKEKSIVADNVPEFVSVKYSPETCTNAGRYKIVAQFTVDENNYNKIADKTASLIINKATYDMSEVVYGETDFVYDGESKSFDIDNLPEGVRAVYSFDEVNAGKYDVIVSFVGDSENYNSIPNQIISI